MKKVNRKEQLELLNEYMEVTASITCDKCYITNSFFDDLGAPYEFFNTGWRVIEMEVYCPACYKKYRKKFKSCKNKGE